MERATKPENPLPDLFQGVEEGINQEILSSCLQAIQEQEKDIQGVLDTTGILEENERQNFVRLSNSLRVLHQHLEFFSKLVESHSTEEVQKLKDELRLTEEYAKIKSKEELNTILISFVLEFLHVNLLVNVKYRISQSIKRSSDGAIQFERNEINTAWIDIMAYKTEATTSYLTIAASYPKDDLKSLPKTSQLWQDAQQHLAVKKPLTKEEIQQIQNEISGGTSMIFAVVQSRTHGIENPDFSGTFSLVREAFRNKKNPEKSEVLAQQFFMNPNKYGFSAMNVGTHPWLVRMQSIALPKIAYDKCISLPRLFPQITKEFILKEYQQKTINRIDQVPMDLSSIPKLEDQKEEVIKELFIESPEKVSVRVVSPRQLSFDIEQPGRVKSFFQKIFSKNASSQVEPTPMSDTIIIHIHGGGWTSGASVLFRSHLYKWAKTFDAVNFSIDYRLAPANPYPAALDDVWQVYQWILHYAKTILGINYKKVILVGDSSGGNLVISLSLMLIKTGGRVPDGCFLIYPGLEGTIKNASRSYLFGLCEPLLTEGLRRMARSAYIPEDCKASEDPFISPIFASDELFEKMPPVRTVVGTSDPLCDNSWELLLRLRRLNKDVKMIAYEGLTHGFYGFSHNPLLGRVCEDAVEILKELMNKEN